MKRMKWNEKKTDPEPDGESGEKDFLCSQYLLSNFQFRAFDMRLFSHFK